MTTTTARLFQFHVIGIPIPQGSKTVGRAPGRSWVRDANPKLKPWRKLVTEAIEAARLREGHDTWHDEAIHAEVWFYLPRPGRHHVAANKARPVRDDAPTYVTTKPDLDKLLRAILDSATDAGVFDDDGQVASIRTTKVYGDDVGVIVQFRPLNTSTT